MQFGRIFEIATRVNLIFYQLIAFLTKIAQALPKAV
jgi:hypothetical protein